MVATAAQIAANRANALASTGPRTPEGKATSSRNALTHGAHASDDTILAAASDIYLDSFRARFQPADTLEEHLVEHLAVLASRRDRLNAAMDALLALNERHALTECLHERYGINADNTYIPGQPSWQAAIRRYDGNTYLDPRHPEPVSDPALDPDPLLCSLAYTLSSPRAAVLFRHEAAVDRRFSATLKELTTLQAQRRAAAATEGKTPPAVSQAVKRPSAPSRSAATTDTTPPAVSPHEPSLQRALDRYLRATATPTDPWFDPIPASAPASLAGRPSAPAAPAPTSRAENEAPVADQSQSASPAPDSSASPAQSEHRTAWEQNEANGPATAADNSDTTVLAAPPLPSRSRLISLPHPDSSGVVPSIRIHPEAVFIPVGPTPPDQRDEAIAPYDLPDDEPTGFLSVLPRHPDEPSSIPAHWPGALLPGH